jgi:hypothetical protein
MTIDTPNAHTTPNRNESSSVPIGSMASLVFGMGVDVNSALGHQIQTPGQSGKYTSAVTESDCVRKAPASVSAVTEPL